MGKKIPYDTAQNMAHTEQNNSIYAKPNKYGYEININHPNIHPMYEIYKDKSGERILSDRQRLEFEHLIFMMIEKKGCAL